MSATSPTRLSRLRRLLGAARTWLGQIRLQLRRWRIARRFLRGSGLEIGALHRPLRVPSRARVRYVDRFDVAGLRRHYPELRAQKLVGVDVIDNGEELSSQADLSADFLIANHFIEHTEDPLGTLANHRRIFELMAEVATTGPRRRPTAPR